MKIRELIGDRAFYRKLFAVMIPVLIQNVITNFVSLLDNIMVGQVGTEPMSGVAIVNQLFFVFNLCVFGCMAGAGIFTTQFYGKNDSKGVRDTFRLKYMTGLLITAFFAALFILRGENLIRLFLHEGGEGLDLEATLCYGMDYMKVMLLQLLPFAVIQVYADTLRGTGETLLPMKAGIIAVFVNLFFNYMFIFGKLGAPEMGVVGAAVATVIARFVECAVVMFWTHRHSDQSEFIVGAYRSFRVPRSLVKQVLILGAPLLLNETLWSCGMTVLNQCYSMRGLEVVSAVNISTTVSNLFFCAFFAMGTTVSIIVGQLLGAGELERAVKEDAQLIAFAVALCAVVGVVMALLAPLIPGIYNTTETVRHLASRLLLVSAAMMPVNAFTNTCYFTLRSGGKTAITFVFDSAFLWVVSVPAAFVLSRFTGIDILYMYIIVQALDLLKCVIGFVMVKNRKWVKNLVAD